MKIARRILLGLLAFVACLQIDISGDMLRVPRSHFTAGHFCYPIVLVASVVYLHWLLRASLMPLSHLPVARRRELKQEAAAHYVKGFMAGAVGIGYLALGLYTVGFLAGIGSAPGTPNLVPYTVWFIALGTLAQARGLALSLTGCKPTSSDLDPQRPTPTDLGCAGASSASGR